MEVQKGISQQELELHESPFFIKGQAKKNYLLKLVKLIFFIILFGV